MDQQYMKTSTKQRVIIMTVAFLMLAATIATYVLVILNNKNSTSSSNLDSETQIQLANLQTQYNNKGNEVTSRAAVLSGRYLDTFKQYKSRVRAYNATTANANGLKTEDLLAGSGRVLTDGDTNYLAYYIGFCADESVFDSSFNDFTNPTSLNAPLSAQVGLIEGWNAGVVGMKIGGVREITIPGELAYGETQEICGATNSPLKFVVMAIEDSEIQTLLDEQDAIYVQMLQLYYSSTQS